MSENSIEPTVSAEVADNLQAISERVTAARPDNEGTEPTLVAVSKRQPDDRIEAALALSLIHI